MSDARRQLRLALGCFRAVGSNPWMLVYPAALSTGVLACTTGLVGYVIFGWPTGGTPSKHLRLAAVIGYFTLTPLVIAFCSVAFAHEVDAVYRGHSVRPGAGARVALGRFSLVLASALVLGPGALLLSRLQGLGPIGELIGEAAMATASVAQVFAFPIVATTDGDPRDAFDELTDSLESGWGSAMVSVLSTRALLTAIGWSGIVTGVPLLILAFNGVSFVSVPPWEPFTVPVLLPLSSLWLAFAVTAFVRGVLYTALYRYVATGKFPSEIGASPDAMLGKSASGRSPTSRGDGRDAASVGRE